MIVEYDSRVGHLKAILILARGMEIETNQHVKKSNTRGFQWLGVMLKFRIDQYITHAQTPAYEPEFRRVKSGFEP